MSTKPILQTPVMSREVSARIYRDLQRPTPPAPKKAALLRRAVRVYQAANAKHLSGLVSAR